jgi:lysozyme family protein
MFEGSEPLQAEDVAKAAVWCLDVRTARSDYYQGFGYLAYRSAEPFAYR